MSRRWNILTEAEMRRLGKNIYTMLYDKNMTRRELAKQVGCHEVFISRIVKGEKVPSLKVLIGISEALGVTTDEILKGVHDVKEGG